MLFSDIFDEDKEQAPRCFRIVVGHVVVLQAYSKALGQWPQSMPFKNLDRGYGQIPGYR